MEIPECVYVARRTDASVSLVSRVHHTFVSPGLGIALRSDSHKISSLHQCSRPFLVSSISLSMSVPGSRALVHDVYSTPFCLEVLLHRDGDQGE